MSGRRALGQPAVLVIGRDLPAALLDAADTRQRRPAATASPRRRALRRRQPAPGRAERAANTQPSHADGAAARNRGPGKAPRHWAETAGWRRRRPLPHRAHAAPHRDSTSAFTPLVRKTPLPSTCPADLDDAPLLVARQQEVFAGMAVDQQPLDAVMRRNRRDMRGQSRFIEAEVRLQRADRGGVNAGQARDRGSDFPVGYG